MRSLHLTRLARLLPALLVVALLAVPAAASASHSMSIGVADDGQLFARPAAVRALVRQWKAAGVEIVRVSAPWAGVAPKPRSLRPPRGFTGNNVRDHRWDFTFLNRAVEALVANHIKVQMALVGPAPYWASANPRKRDGRWLPSPKRFAQFAAVVAARFPGVIDSFILWNEPNEPVGMKPQSRAPDNYRAMVNAAIPAIRSHYAGARILIGALASTNLTAGGNHHEGTTPIVFLKRMACVSASYRPIRSGGCRGYRAPTANGIVLHPHGLKQAPTAHSANPGFATIGDLRRFEGVVDRLTRAGRLRVAGGGRFPIDLAEFGYQTSGPTAVSYATQARWLAEGSRIAWHDPRVEDLNWYVWRDERNRGGWQSGLYTRSGRPKPARTAFSFPFLASRSGAVWGQVRPGGAHTVTIQARGRRGGWRTIATFDTDQWGGFERHVSVPGGTRYLRARSGGGGPTSLAQRV